VLTRRCGRVGAVVASVSLAGTATACFAPKVPREGVPELFAAVQESPALRESALDGCVVVHHLWKAEILAVHRTSREGVGARVRMLVDSVYEPHASFWDGYVSDFKKWARRHLDLSGDPRSTIPTQVDLLDLIAGVTSRIEEVTGKRGCAEWYALYGPGWANLGGLSTGQMLIDFFGLPTDRGVENLMSTLPHEVAHVIHGQRTEDPDRGTLLGAIISEGLASYFADLYWGTDMSAPEALGYDPAEWDWAVDHESQLWALAKENLWSTDQQLISQYRRADRRVVSGAPVKVGYFLGYRLVEAYVSRHGESSLTGVFQLPVRVVLEDSGYSGGGT